VDTTTFQLEEMTALDGVFVVRMPDHPTMHEVMSRELVDSISKDWTGAILAARRMLSSLASMVQTHYTMIRDPHKLVLPILKAEQPIAVVLRQIAEALKRARPLKTSPMDHARDYRNAVAMLLLVTVVFRSDTLRDLEWRSDGTGNLIRTAEGYDVVVGSDRFKNGRCEWLFGPTFRRRDYERELKDWKGLNGILDHYLKVCRPILLKGRNSDLLFPTAQKAEDWSHSTFNTVITGWTRTWSVRNERHGTGLDGVLPWGPHCIRDIVATHIVGNHAGEERWELASAILGASVAVVRRNYAFVNARRELGKADSLYADAFDSGFGDLAV
jgi:hypothetical protein